jgi:chromosomal replication initiation ATPase DnaA
MKPTPQAKICKIVAKHYRCKESDLISINGGHRGTWAFEPRLVAMFACKTIANLDDAEIAEIAKHFGVCKTYKLEDAYEHIALRAKESRFIGGALSKIERGVR